MLNAPNLNLINGLCCVAMTLWARSATLNPTWETLIPGFFGFIFIVFSNSLRVDHRVISPMSLILTLILTVMLASFPLPHMLELEDNMGILRVSLMVLTGVISTVALARHNLRLFT